MVSAYNMYSTLSLGEDMAKRGHRGRRKTDFKLITGMFTGMFVQSVAVLKPQKI